MSTSGADRSPTNWWRTVGVLLAVVGLLAAGCSSTGESQVASDDGVSATDTQADAAEADGDSSSDEGAGQIETDEPSAFETFESPIAEFLGVDFGGFSDDDFEAEFADFERDAQLSIAACMAEQGFEYTPFDTANFSTFSDDFDDYGSPEWIEKYALGVSTQMFSQSDLGPDLVGFDDSEFEVFDEGFEDPNFAYADSLPEAERLAYEAALWGQQPDFDPNVSDEELEEFFSNFEPTGCQAEAYNEVGIFGGEKVNDFYNEFGSQIDELYERAEADPRLVEARASQVACLSDAGHEFDAESDLGEQIYEDIDGRLQAVFSGGFGADPFEGLDFESMSEEEIDEVLSQFDAGPQFSDEDLATIGEVQAYEFELADAVVECLPGFFTGGDDMFFEVLADYEQEFLDENADALAAFAG